MLQDQEVKPQEKDNVESQEVNGKKIKDEDDEISLIDLFAVLLRFKWMIIGITTLAAIGVVIYCIISLKLPPEDSYMPNEYKVSANMLINDDSSSSGLPSSSSLSSAASLLGISLSGGSSSTSDLVIYLAASNPFLDSVAQEFDLYSKLEPDTKSPIANVRKSLTKQFETEFDSASGVLTISFTDIDPEYAVKVVDYSVDWISDKLTELGNGMKDAFNRAVQINSPSKVFFESGMYICLGLANGIKEYSSQAINEVGNLGREVVNESTSMIGRAVDILNDMDSLNPVITPTLDLSNVISGAKQINSMFNASRAIGVSSDDQNGANNTSGLGGTTFIQNNYSPKALSRIEIYRDTRNLFSQAKGALS